MTKAYLINQLNAITDARRVNRLRVANLVIENKELFPFLLEIVNDVENKTSIKAAWVLEFVCHKKLEWLAEYIDLFCAHLNKLHFGSAIRPIAKICELLAKAYTSKEAFYIKEKLTKRHIDLIVEASFDWLISHHKVAIKVYSMETLLIFGKNYDWVYEELAHIITKNIYKESGAYKSRGKKVLLRLKKNK
jgi:hypothetical protein